MHRHKFKFLHRTETFGGVVMLVWKCGCHRYKVRDVDQFWAV